MEESNNNQPDGAITIDLTNGNKLDESWLRMLGFGVKSILNAMFGGDSVPVNVRGHPSEVRAFTRAVGREKKYLDSIRAYGLDDPRTFKDKSKLKQATTAFTRKTGLKWPFK